MAWISIADNAKSTLAADLTDVGLTATVTAGASFPASGQFILTACKTDGTDLEKILVDSRSGEVLTINASGRGYGSTTATAHVTTDTVYIGSIKHSLEEIQAAVDLNTAKVTNATHVGDVTGSATLTIAANAVTLAKLATQAANTFLVNATSGAAVPTAEACTAAGRALLDDATAADQRTTLGLGTAATTAAGDYATSAQANATHTGDATGATALTISDAAKHQAILSAQVFS
jgi:hypothetical protein